jgi:hypothetical protein
MKSRLLNKITKNKPSSFNFLFHKSFTLIEMIIVLAIIIGLVAILIAVLKPSKMLQGLRDTQRIADLKKIVDSITYYETENYGLLSFYGTPTLVYISLPDTDASCSSWLNQLPTLPIGYGYRCSATPTNIDGTGWIPINFSASSLVNLQKLPIDPINKPPYYYTYVVGGSYELTALMERDTNKGPDSIAGKDGGTENFVYEVGTNKNITPFPVKARGEPLQGLVGWWTFDEGNGTTAYDYSGNNNTSTLYSSTTICSNPPTSGCPQWTSGKIGQALSFDGVDDWVKVPDADSLDITQQITLEVWINPKKLNAYQYIIDKHTGAGDGYFLALWNTNQIRCSLYGVIGGDIYSNKVFTSDDLNKWWHIVGVYDGSKMAIYINGILDNSAGRTGTIKTNTANMGIGASIGATFFFQGLIDEVRIYNRALSADEIKALYDATK